MIIQFEKEIKELQEELINKGSEIDEFNEYNWHDLCLGFLMGRGVPQNDAIEILISLNY